MIPIWIIVDLTVLVLNCKLTVKLRLSGGVLLARNINKDVVSRSFIKKHVSRLVSWLGCWESRKQKFSIVLHEVQVGSQHDPSARRLFGLDSKRRRENPR